ncbi:EAL domain-containing protein [Saccharospirillum mangrovi]|uniref:bifunctional diguanylate cyclase/phosphodiesterase n=1 Tax=Saccharospirillum mangrovi TaxID=2161747 RepID=UPI000D374FA2|nr:EAL domain-containing protein [Saccharospirillum mangrovi]
MPALSLVLAIVLLGTTLYTTAFWVDVALTLAALVCVVFSIWRGRRGQLLIKLAVLAAIPVVPITTWLEGLVLELQLSSRQSELSDDLNIIAKRVESQLVINRSHLDSIALLVSNAEQLPQSTYQGWLDYLIPPQNFAYLNIAITDHLIITHVYPATAENLALIGLDMRTVPEQRAAIEQVMRDQQPLVVGPIESLQGDQSLIYRLPIPGRPDTLVSGVLSLDRLLARAALSGSRMNLQLTLVRSDQHHQLLSGGELSPLAVQARFFHSGFDWQFLAEPAQGFEPSVWAPWGARAAGLMLWICLGAIVGWQHRLMRIRDQERLRLKTQERELLAAQRLGRLGSWTTNDYEHYSLSSPLAEMLGIEQQTLSGTQILAHIYEPDREYVLSHLRFVRSGEATFTRLEHRVMTDEALIWVEHSLALNAEGEMSGMVRDITEIKSTAAELQKLAYYDSLTGASNRNFFGKQVQQAISLSRRHDNHLALIIIDLDNFKAINSQYGHSIGDEVLKVMTDRLGQCTRRSDSIARLSGDRFAACLQNLKDPSHAIFVADNILKSVAEVLTLDDRRISLTATLGIATCPEDDQDYEGLVKKAEMALQKAKEDERGFYQFYSDQLNIENDRRQEVMRLLPNALNNNEFHLVLQPRVSSVDGRWSSIEVLLRWESEVLGFVSPAEFIPLAEGSHLIVDIGNWVIREALSQFASNLDRLDPDVVISINLSPRQLEHADLVRYVAAEIQMSGVPAERVEFEITEHSLTEESDTTLATLADLSQMGIRFAMDDFGTGYSNLGMLQSLPLSVLKIDKRFVQNLSVGGKHLELIRAIINLGHTLGLSVVAEGVETELDVQTLTALGCDELQGFYFYRPQRLETLLARPEKSTV